MQHILETLIKQNRTCRRFDEQTPVEALQIKRWLNVIRYTASMRNAQPLKYIIVTDPEECNQITALQHWAAMLPDWDGPAVGERPSGGRPPQTLPNQAIGHDTSPLWTL